MEEEEEHEETLEEEEEEDGRTLPPEEGVIPAARGPLCWWRFCPEVAAAPP